DAISWAGNPEGRFISVAQPRLSWNDRWVLRDERRWCRVNKLLGDHFRDGAVVRQTEADGSRLQHWPLSKEGGLFLPGSWGVLHWTLCWINLRAARGFRLRGGSMTTWLKYLTIFLGIGCAGAFGCGSSSSVNGPLGRSGQQLGAGGGLGHPAPNV